MKLRIVCFLLLTLVGAAQEPWDDLQVYPLRNSHFSLKGHWWTPQLTEPRQGSVVVSDGRIESLTFNSTDGTETRGLILPGLIDLHDHIAYAYAPRFAGNLWPEEQTFANRYEWQELTGMFHEKHSRLARPAGALFYLFGEVRELVGGTTSVANHVSGSAYGVLARNLHGNSQTHGLPLEITSVVFFFERAELKLDPPRFVVSPDVLRRLEEADLALVHLAEGRRDDGLTRAEIENFLAWAKDHPELARKIVPIHLVGLVDEDFARLKSLGIDRAVWSPSSNMALYGQTMDVGAALRNGFIVALGTDWYPSGSDSLFDELRLAKQLVREGLVSKVDPKCLNFMVLESPSRILGGQLGTLIPGTPADLLVIPWKDSLEASLEQADVDSTLLVTVSGQPLFGTTDLMEELLSEHSPSPQRPDEFAYGFSLATIWNEVRSRFPQATPPEPLGERLYPRLQRP